MTPTERLAVKSTPMPSGCIEWTGHKTPTGYGIVGVNGRVMRAHRLAYSLKNGAIPDGMCVCHRCDNRACVNVEHLFIATHAGNMRDMAEKGRANNEAARERSRTAPRPRGERHHATKVTESQVRSMRELRATGATIKVVANAFGIAWPTAYSIVTGATWAHVPGAVTRSNANGV